MNDEGGQREPFEWETEHSPLSIEGRIEAAGMFGRGLGRYRSAVSRFFLIAAIAFAALALIGLILELTN